MITLLVLLFCISNSLAKIETSGATTENQITQNCGELGDCVNSQTICNSKCGCDSSAAVLFYNETLDECVVDVKKLLFSLRERYNTQEKIHEEVERVFKGIIFSAILFMTCATVCALTACVYCFRINYVDTRLKSDIEALANKLKRDCRFKKTLKTPTHPGSESCNVVCADAGVFVV